MRLLTGNAREYAYACAVRPVVTLTSGIQATAGSGTQGDPYKL